MSQYIDKRLPPELSSLPCAGAKIDQVSLYNIPFRIRLVTRLLRGAGKQTAISRRRDRRAHDLTISSLKMIAYELYTALYSYMYTSHKRRSSEFA